ncbi:MAG: EAL domain-containing protein [Sedimenticola sp.]|nr:EAL domain-containing protein [Sedimenticola sp.]
MLDLKSKLLFTIGTVFLISFGILTYFDYRNTRQEIAQALTNEARLIRSMMTATRRVYRHQLMISGLPLDGTTLGFLPAHALSRVSNEFSRLVTSGLTFNNVSDRPRNSELMADRVELEAMDYFRHNPDARERLVPFDSRDGEPYYHFAAPLWITRDCLKCHGKPEDAPPGIREIYNASYHYELGDLKGILSIKLPARELEQRAISQVWESSFNYLVGFILTFLAVFLLLKRTLLGRIATLTRASESLAGGNYGTRIDLTGSDEISQVSAAFNSMAEAIAERTRNLEENEQRTRSIFQSAGEGMLLVSDDGLIRDHNRAAESIFGFTAEQLSEQPLTCLLPEQLSPVERRRLLRIVSHSDPGDRTRQRIEITGRRRSGEHFPMELNISQVKIGSRTLYLSIIEDISERKQAEQVIQEKQQFLQSVIDGVIDPIMVIGEDYRVIMMNRSARDNVPAQFRALSTHYCYQVSHNRDTPCSGNEHPCPLKQVLSNRRAVTLLHEHHTRELGLRRIELDASPYRDSSGRLRGIIEVSKDITERLETEEQLRDNEVRLSHLAQHDVLTGLPNRLLFHDRLEHAMHKARRSGHQVAVLFLDLDRFKNINDGLGHDVGDGMLREVASRLLRVIRDEDTVARLGGDEFVIILEDIPDASSASSVARKCLAALSQKMLIKGIDIFPTVSIGIALFPEDEQSVDGLMKCADAAMYRAKDGGRDSFQFYTRDMNDRTISLLRMEGSLRHALEKQQLLLHYQPKYDLRKRELVGMEALVRWQHPEKGLIPPADFIPLAEDTGMIVAIGEWVLDEACRQLREWHETGFRRLQVAVNISARHFNPSLLETLDQVLMKTGLEPECLELEITESVLMENAEAAVVTLHQIRNRGIALAIDDFGTGYSSLSYLKQFPIGSLKIDRSFVQDVMQDSNDSAIVSSVVALARNMDLQVTAEGIETEEQLRFIQDSGCDFGQGYLLGRPVDASRFEALHLRPRVPA